MREAARALTGWSVTARGEFREVADQHDDGEKTILGSTGNWRGDDLLALLLEQRATARRLAFRLCGLFFGEGVVDGDALDQLAARLRATDLDVGAAVATILRSRLFFANRDLGGRVLSPPEFIVGAVRALGCFDPPPSTLLLAEWCTRCGQELFYPPTVFGWGGGRAWISTASLLARARCAGLLCEGALSAATGDQRVAPPLAWMEAQHVSDRTIARERLAALVVAGPGEPSGPDEAGGGDTLPAQIARLLSSPMAQLG